MFSIANLAKDILKKHIVYRLKSGGPIHVRPTCENPKVDPALQRPLVVSINPITFHGKSSLKDVFPLENEGFCNLIPSMCFYHIYLHGCLIFMVNKCRWHIPFPDSQPMDSMGEKTGSLTPAWCLLMPFFSFPRIITQFCVVGHHCVQLADGWKTVFFISTCNGCQKWRSYSAEQTDEFKQLGSWTRGTSHWITSALLSATCMLDSCE